MADQDNISAETKNEERIARSLETVLNKHGFCFQYAVIQRTVEFRGQGECEWWLEGAEMPVGSASDVTHIDFVAEPIDRLYNADRKTYVIAECKKVDAKRANWTFAKSPYTWRNSLDTCKALQFETLDLDSVGSYNAGTLIKWSSAEIFDLPFELKTEQTGDGTGSELKAINSAITQVLRGQKGFIRYLMGLDEPTRRKKLGTRTVFIPVIFTTADLYSTISNINTANLADGKIPRNSIQVEKPGWIWFNHNRSIDLSHGMPVDPENNANYDRYFRDFTRSIAIVSPSGIDGFIQIPPRWLLG